ncbi:MAG: domain protein putative component of TonB system [Myxococcaceae bacterium]|nr:domain protein putative component of TonB system [Myxococcaceae bacterium]
MSNSDDIQGIDASTALEGPATLRPPPDPDRLRELDETAAKFEAQKRWQDLIKTLQAKSELLDERAERVALYERIAGIYLERFSNQAEAIKANEQILDIDPENAKAIDYLKSMYEKRKDWDKLLRILRREVAAAPASQQLDQYLGLARFVTEKVKRPEVCTEMWEEVLARDPGHPEALTQLAGFYEKSKDYAKLAEVLRSQAAMTADVPQRIQLLVKLGLIAGDRLNDDAIAVEAWRGVMALDPNDRRAQEALKKRYLAMHAWDELEHFYAESGKWDELIRLLEREAENPAADDATKVSLFAKVAQLWEVRKEKVDRAARYLEKVLEIDPANRDAALRLVPMYTAANDAKRLATALEVKRLGDAPGAEQVDTLRRLGELYEGALGEGGLAFDRFRDALAQAPSEPRSVVDLERAAALTGRWREAENALESAIANPAVDEAARVTLRLRAGSILAAHLDDVEGAGTQYRAVLAGDAAHPEALAALESLLRAHGQWAELLNVLDRRLEIVDEAATRKALLLDVVHVAEERLQNLPRAVEAATAIVTEFGDDPEALAALARLYEKQEQWSPLAEVLRRELDVHEALGDDAAATAIRFHLATVTQLRLGQAAQALELYRAVLATAPEHDGARQALEGLLRDPTLRHAAAEVLQPVYELRGDWEALVRALEILVAEGDDRAERVALLQRIGAVTATELGQAPRALEAYGRAFQEDPANAEVTETLMRVSEAVEGWPQVVVLFREAAEQHAGTSLGRDLYVRVAEIEGRFLGNVQNAVTALERVLESNPGDVAVLEALERTWRSANRWPEVLATLRRRLEVTSDPEEYDRVQSEIAVVQDERLNDADASVATYHAMLERDPTNALALAALDRMFTRLGKWPELAENLAQQVSLAADGESRSALQFRLAEVQDQKLNHREAAIEILREVVTREESAARAVDALEAFLGDPAYTATVVDTLEPVYRASGAWDRLVLALEVQAGLSEKATKVDLLHRVAELRETALDDGAGAFVALSQALTEDPSREDTLTGLDRLARSLEIDRDFVEVIEARIGALDEGDADVRVALHRRASAVSEERLRDLDRAIGHEVAALAVQPANVDAVSSLERLYQLTDRPKELTETLVRKAEILDDLDERKAYLWRAAEIYETVLNDVEGAVRTYRRIVEVDDSEVAALDSLIRIFVTGQRWPELLAAYEKKAALISDAEEKKRLYFEVAAVYESELHDNDRAIDAYNHVLELDPTDLLAIQKLDALFTAQGRWQDLLSVLEREADLSADPDEVASYRFRVAKLYEGNLADVNRAVEIYREIVETIPDHAPSVGALTAILRGTEAPLAAAGVLEPLLSASGAFEPLVEVLEVEVRHTDDVPRKLELLQRIADVNESALDRPEAAFDAMARAVALDPRVEENLGNFERLAEGLSRWDTVVAVYDAAVDSLHDDPYRHVELLLRVGQIHEVQRSDADAAITRYRKVLDVDAGNASALRALDRLYEALEQWPQVAEILRRELGLSDLSPDDAVALRYRLGQALEHRLGDPAGALAVYREIIDVQADHAETVAALEAMFARGVLRAEVAATLDPLYRMYEDWEKLADLQARTLDLIPEAGDRVLAMRGIAEILEEKRSDAAGAFGWLGRAVKEAPLDDRSLTEVERLAAATGAWDDLTNVYADVVEAESSTDEIRVAIGKRLARVHEEERGDLPSAEGAYQFVLDVAPLDADALESLDRLHSASGEAEKLVTVLTRRAQITEDPEEKVTHTLRLAGLLRDDLGRVDDAVVQYRAVIEKVDPRNRPSLDALEAIYAAQERWPDLYAVQERKLDAADSDEERAETYTRMARIAESYLGRPDDAVKLYEQVLVIRGEEAETLSAVAALHESAGRWQDLIDVLERQLGSEADSDRRVEIALRVAAVYLERLGDVERAIEGYRRVLDIEPASFEALRALAAIYRHGQRWDELVVTLQTLIALGTATLENDEIKAAWSELGTIYWTTLGQGDESVDAWRNALEVDPADATALAALLVIHAAREEWREVVDVLGRQAAGADDAAAKVALHLQAADVWEQRLGEPDGARASYEAVLEVDPLHGRAFTALESLHRAAGRWDELSGLYVARHDKLAEDGNVAEAVPFMVRAAKVFDVELGDREQAFAAAQIAFEEDVTNAEAIAALEAITGAGGKWNDLLKTTMEAYTAEPVGPRKTQLGLHAAKWYGLELGHPEWAIPIYTQILAAEPGNLHALRSQGELYRRLGQWQPLAKTLQRAVEVARSPEDRRSAHVQLGEVYEKSLKQPAQAVEQFHAALAIDPNDGAALAALARVHAAAEDWPALVEVLRRHVASVSDPAESAELRMRVGSVLEDRIGDLEGAAAEYAAVLAADPVNLPALRGLEGIYARLGRSQELLNVLEQQLEVVATERERIKLLTRIGAMLEEEFVRPALAIERFERVLEIDPSHDPSLRALERLYRQTSQWNELIATLERHLTATGERRERVPVFLQMGRVYADEKRDLEHAEDAFLNVLQIDAENVDALDALARIYESRSDWHRATDMLEQLAQFVSGDPAKAVELRVRVGKIAETSLGDELRAVDQYQAALDVDPNHLPALEALRAIATRREDWYEVARYLDREQGATELPRGRAKLLTELGRVNAQHLDDQAQAIRCYEEALRCDPDQEEAAWPLCNFYVSEQRWADAEPLAEMLTRRASRRDPAEQLQIQLTMGRVAVALGKGDRAIKAFTAAQALDRGNVESISALALAYFDKQDWDNAFKHYQVLLVHHKDELDAEARADLYYRLGVVKSAQGDRRRAANFLEKSLEEYPGYRPALGALIDTHSAGAEWEQAIGYRTQLLDMEDDEEKRFTMLQEIGALWQEKAKNTQKAIQAYAGAAELKPQNHVLLHKLLGLYTESKQWSKVIDVVQRISDLETNADRKARYAYSIASIYNQELKNPDEALTFYNQALDFNPAELKPFAKVNEILTARKDWKSLERGYRAMLKRVINKPDSKDLEFSLLHSLGLIYRDRLMQPDAALRAFQMASERKPDDIQEHKILAELATRMGNTAEAVSRWQTIAAQDVGNTEAMHAIYDLYYQSHQHDKAWCVAATTSFLLRDRAREDLRAFFEQYRPRKPLAPTGRLTEEHWVKQLFHPNEDPVVGKIFAAILGAVRRAKCKPLQQFGFTQKELQDPQNTTVALVRSLAQSSQALNLPLPSIFLKPQQQGGLGYVPSDPIASFAGSGLLSGLRPEELAFVAAKHMTYYRNEHYIRVLLPTTQELTVMLLAAIKLVKSDQDVPAESAQAAQTLAPLLAQDPIAVEGLRKVVRYFLEQGGSSNIKKWYQSVELTAARAGFLMCGDLEITRKMLALEPGLPGDLGPAEKLKDVILFSMSETYFSLREGLGINFQVQSASY